MGKKGGVRGVKKPSQCGRVRPVCGPVFGLGAREKKKGWPTSTRGADTGKWLPRPLITDQGSRKNQRGEKVGSPQWLEGQGRKRGERTGGGPTLHKQWQKRKK